MGSYIQYGSGNNTVHIDLDQNTHNGGGGHDRLILHARNEKSGLQFGLLNILVESNMQWATFFEHNKIAAYNGKSKLPKESPLSLAYIAEMFARYDESLGHFSYFSVGEKNKYTYYEQFEEVDIYGTNHNDFIPYLNGSEYHGGDGWDVFYADWRNWTSDITWKNNGEAVTFTPTLKTGTAPAVTISGMEILYLYLGSGNDHIELNSVGEVHGGDGDDHLHADVVGGELYGGRGNDTLSADISAMFGSIKMVGGTGDDTYYVNPRVTVEEMPNEGTDTIIIGGLYQDFDLREYANIENLTSHSGQSNGTLQGNALDNRIESFKVGATMRGHAGNDTYIVRHKDDEVIEQNDEGIDEVRTFLSDYTLPDNVERLTTYNFSDNILIGNSLDNYISGRGWDDRLYGQAGNDQLEGGRGNDLLDGGEGADTMYGEYGNDVYYVDNVGDKVIEDANGGIDEVKTYLSFYRLPDNVENLYAQNNHESNIFSGNHLNNYIRGNSQNDRLLGQSGDDELHGEAGNDQLEGGEGNDILNGGTGADRLEGGAGNDSYYVDNSGDKVIEKANGGRDTVFSTIHYDLSKADNIHIENAVLQGTGNLTLQGNNEANLLKGNAGNNHLKGLAGNDWLEGGAGDDILNGNAGADRMIGGTGNDVYYVDNRGDVVVEEANGGRDTVNVLFDYDLMKVAHIENAILIGTANAGLQGNNEANLLKGNAGNNHLKGLTGNDWLEGGAGDDILNGNAGADRMIGGTGNDVYYVDNRGDVVVEEANGGRDTVNVFFDYDLMKVAHIENAALIGTANAGLQGNNGANLLKGNAGNNQLKGLGGNDWLDGGAGNDVLIGGSGKDTLVGGAGKDTFKFVDMADSTLSLRDVITDFKHGEDKIDLSALDANTKSAGNQAFSFIGAAGFSAAGQVRFAGGVVYGDVNGDKQADFAIELKNVTTLQAGDFIL